MESNFKRCPNGKCFNGREYINLNQLMEYCPNCGHKIHRVVINGEKSE